MLPDITSLNYRLCKITFSLFILYLHHTIMMRYKGSAVGLLRVVTWRNVICRPKIRGCVTGTWYFTDNAPEFYVLQHDPVVV